MQEADMIIPVAIDNKTFRDFAVFDGFIRQKRWRPLLLFALIMLGSALVCIVMRSRAEQAVMLAAVLTAVGLGLPIVYMFSFLSSIRRQSKMMRLHVPRHAYTIAISNAEGIDVEAGREHLTYRWENIYAVYRWRTYTFLYVAQQKAYLMPDNQTEGRADALWALLHKTVPDGKLFDLRRKPYQTTVS